jgi:hypothetical protein
MRRNFEIRSSNKKADTPSQRIDIIALEQQRRQKDALEQKAYQKEMYRRAKSYRERFGITDPFLDYIANAEMKVEEAENNICFFLDRGLKDAFYGYDMRKENTDKTMGRLEKDLKRSRRGYDSCVSNFEIHINSSERGKQKEINAISKKHAILIDQFITGQSKRTSLTRSALADP